MPTAITNNGIKLIIQIQNPLALAADDVPWSRWALLVMRVGLVVVVRIGVVGVLGGRGGGFVGGGLGGLAFVSRHGYREERRGWV